MNRKLKKTHQAVTGTGSALSKYQDIIVGSRSILFLIYFDFCLFVGKIPGALGMLLRKFLWPHLFGSCGKGITFGSDIILRHPKRIHLGDNVVISEGCILDARNNETNKVICIGNDVILSNNVMISCKNGTAKIGDRTGIGAQTIIHSTNDCPVEIGADVIIGAQSYLVGGGNYNTDRFDIPIWQQGIKPMGGVKLEDDIWLGAKVTVIDGVTMGKGCIAAAGSVTTKSVPEKMIYGGIPAKEIKKR